MNKVLKLGREFYDLHTPAPSQQALEFYVHHAKEANGSILEPMCGSGRFLIPLAERGFHIDGTDASGHMLSACRERCEAKGLEPLLQEQLLHELSMQRSYELIMIPAGSFCVLGDPEQVRESLRRIHQHLAPSGRFVVEIIRRKMEKPEIIPAGACWVDRPDGARIMYSWLGYFTTDDRIAHTMARYELIRDGRLIETEFEDASVRYYDIDEYSALLESAGFRSVRCTKLNTWSPPDANDDRVVFVGAAS